jgi:hypothetical protein
MPVPYKPIFLHHTNNNHSFCSEYIKRQTQLTGIVYPDLDEAVFLATNISRWDLPKQALFYTYGIDGFSNV